jgi:hypothetical protein
MLVACTIGKFAATVAGGKFAGVRGKFAGGVAVDGLDECG